MAVCDMCGNEYDKSVHSDDERKTHDFDSFVRAMLAQRARTANADHRPRCGTSARGAGRAARRRRRSRQTAAKAPAHRRVHRRERLNAGSRARCSGRAPCLRRAEPPCLDASAIEALEETLPLRFGSHAAPIVSHLDDDLGRTSALAGVVRPSDSHPAVGLRLVGVFERVRHVVHEAQLDRRCVHFDVGERIVDRDADAAGTSELAQLTHDFRRGLRQAERAGAAGRRS